MNEKEVVVSEGKNSRLFNNIVLIRAGFLSVSLTLVFIAFIVYAMSKEALGKMERMVQIAERMDARVETICKATAPMGGAAVEKLTDAVESADAEDMSRAAQDGLKEIGRAGKAAAVAFFGKNVKGED